jgi:hypothetical protein
MYSSTARVIMRGPVHDLWWRPTKAWGRPLGFAWVPPTADSWWLSELVSGRGEPWCALCSATHVPLPWSLLPVRRDDGPVIGAALLAYAGKVIGVSPPTSTRPAATVSGLAAPLR